MISVWLLGLKSYEDKHVTQDIDNDCRYAIDMKFENIIGKWEISVNEQTSLANNWLAKNP